MSKFIRSAYADEITSALVIQIWELEEQDINHIDSRSVNGIKVKDLEDRDVTRIREYLRIKGTQVACIGNPIGKITLIGTQDALKILPSQLLFSPFTKVVYSFPITADPSSVLVAEPEEISLTQDAGDHTGVHINFRDAIRARSH